MVLAFLDIVLLVGLLLLLTGFVTQVLLPIKRGTSLFPQFRPSTPLKEKVSAAEKELAEVTELTALESQLKELNRRKAELEGKK